MAELLSKSGFRYVSDLQQLRPIELSKELNISVEEASSVLDTLSQHDGGGGGAGTGGEGAASNAASATTAKELSLKSLGLKPIITFCKSIDTMLGGGVPLGQITEICGLPGIGKTQLVTQLALDVQIPKIFAGNEGETIYIDSEGSFLPERAAMMAAALSEHLNKLATAKIKPNAGESDERLRERVQEKMASAAHCSRDQLLNGIHVFRVHEQSEMISTINLLPRFLNAKPKVKLIVVDSVAFHFRQDLRDQQSRMRVVAQMSQTLNELAYKNQLAVVVVNHVTNQFSGGSGAGGGRATVVPALGEQWSHCITNRVMLSWEDKARGVRRATLTKSPTKPQSVATYRIADVGIRDCSKSAGAGAGLDGAGGGDAGNKRASVEGEVGSSKHQRL